MWGWRTVLESTFKFKSQLYSLSRCVYPGTSRFRSLSLSFPARTMGVIIRPPLDGWEALTTASHPSSPLTGHSAAISSPSLPPLTDGKTEAQGGAAAGSEGRRGGPCTAGSAPASSPPLPLAAEGRAAGRGQGRCTWSPRGEVTGGAPEVGLGDPGPCVPAPASWLWRGRKLGRFSGGPRPAAPPRFLPAPRARPAPPLPSPSSRPPGPSFPRSAGDPQAPAPPRPRPAPPGFVRGSVRGPWAPRSSPLPGVRHLLPGGVGARSPQPPLLSAWVSRSSSLSSPRCACSVRVPLCLPLCLCFLRGGSFPPVSGPLHLRAVSPLCRFSCLPILGSLYLPTWPLGSFPQPLLSLESQGSASPCPFFYGPFFPFSPTFSLSPYLCLSLIPCPLIVFLFTCSVSPSRSLCVSVSLPFPRNPASPCPPGFSHHHPQMRAINSPGAPAASPFPESNRCGLAVVRIGYQPHQTGPCICGTEICINKYGHLAPFCVPPPPPCSGT